MRIYNFLFYKSYLLAKHSRNFDDIPVLGGIIFVAACVMFNIFTIALVLEGIGFFGDYLFKEKYKYPFSILLVLTILFYYLYKGRYKKIIRNYEDLSKGKNQVHPVLVIVFYFLVSFGFLLLAGLYKNRDWIFA